ncbi:MAG: HD domain-containing protein [Elusimicrobiales bacterium]|nr:HD domain-containing protein [Elusimicrobiales bacterium]
MAMKKTVAKSQEHEEFLALAFYYAMKAHESQFRKSTGRPYIEHPVSVAKLLMEMGSGHELVAAGFLHDVVEDTGCGLRSIAELFGRNVRNYVAHVTEDKTRPWQARKKRAIEYIARAPQAELLLLLADKLDNLRSISRDYADTGESIWKRFARPRRDEKWYYESLAKAFAERLPKSAYAREFARLTVSLFNPACTPPET